MQTGSYVLTQTHRHTQKHTHSHTRTAEWRWCGGLCQLLFLLSFYLALPLPPLSPLLLRSPHLPHHHQHHPLSPMKHSHTYTHIHKHTDVNTSTSQNTEGCVYFRHASPECMDSCLSPLPLSVSPFFPPLVHFLLPRGFLAAGAV